MMYRNTTMVIQRNMPDYLIKGPLRVQPYATVCTQCHIVVTAGEPIFLIESAEAAEPDTYLHNNCLRAYLDAYD